MNIQLYDKVPIAVTGDPQGEGEIPISRFEVEEIHRVASLRLKDLLFWENTGICTPLEDPTDDLLSHFTLKSVLAVDKDLSRRFLSYEVALFVSRLPTVTQTEVSFWANTHMEPLSSAEKKPLLPFLTQVTRGSPWFLRLKVHPLSNLVRLSNGICVSPEAYVRGTLFFRIPFHRVISLVAKRLVYVQNGYAYVPLPYVKDTLKDRFMASLDLSMRATREKGHSCAQFSDLYLWAKTLMRPSVPLPLSENLDIDRFPYCMRLLYRQLTSSGHLSYPQRTSLILFLKAIGVSHTRVTSLFTSYCVGDFQKQATYAIRHLYGLEGSHKSYGCPSCKKIGCPIPASDIEDICPPQHPIRFFQGTHSKKRPRSLHRVETIG